MLTETEIERIASAINALRPDWPIPSLRTLLHRDDFTTKTRRDTAVALTWVACETETQTPARVLENGPWWRLGQAEGNVVRFPPRRDQACPKHPGEWPTNCRGCAADRLTGTTSNAGNQRRSTTASDRVGELRHLHHIATSGFCSHGVDPARCHETHPTGDETNREEQG